MHIKSLILSEDKQYKMLFVKAYMPPIYEMHTLSNYISCAFCSNLTRSKCHIHCLKCSAGTYIHCSPLLPGLMYYDKKNPDEAELDRLIVPWLYKKTCKNFNRLDIKKYLRNFKVPFSWLTIYNYEILEGLVFGISSGERPCQICATIDYSIYRECMNREAFEKDTPCPFIGCLVETIYLTGKLPNTKAAISI